MLDKMKTITSEIRGLHVFEELNMVSYDFYSVYRLNYLNLSLSITENTEVPTEFFPTVKILIDDPRHPNSAAKAAAATGGGEGALAPPP